jgi:hypothetical protein
MARLLRILLMATDVMNDDGNLYDGNLYDDSIRNGHRNTINDRNGRRHRDYTGDVQKRTNALERLSKFWV